MAYCYFHNGNYQKARIVSFKKGTTKSLYLRGMIINTVIQREGGGSLWVSWEGNRLLHYWGECVCMCGYGGGGYLGKMKLRQAALCDPYYSDSCIGIRGTE